MVSSLLDNPNIHVPKDHRRGLLCKLWYSHPVHLMVSSSCSPTSSVFNVVQNDFHIKPACQCIHVWGTCKIENIICYKSSWIVQGMVLFSEYFALWIQLVEWMNSRDIFEGSGRLVLLTLIFNVFNTALLGTVPVQYFTFVESQWVSHIHRLGLETETQHCSLLKCLSISGFVVFKIDSC